MPVCYRPAPQARTAAARRLIIVGALAVCGLGDATASAPPASPNRYPRCGLSTFEAGSGPPMVLLHGYGSAAEEWFPFIETIHPPDKGGFVFPAGPEQTVPPDGPVGKRAWWRLRLDTYVRPGAQLPDLSQARPAGLTRAAGKIRVLLQELEQRHGLGQGQIILGGFSQGAMVAADIAFASATPLRALVLLSATPVDERTWIRGLRRRRGLPVFIAHGRQDQVLPYAGSQHLQQVLSDAGLNVTFVPFDGGHEIPVPVVDALNEFLAKLPPAAHTAAGAAGRTVRTQEKLGR
jgi:phospholipase/carboxylesterase